MALCWPRLHEFCRSLTSELLDGLVLACAAQILQNSSEFRSWLALLVILIMIAILLVILNLIVIMILIEFHDRISCSKFMIEFGSFFSVQFALIDQIPILSSPMDIGGSWLVYIYIYALLYITIISIY